ncbi:hypothetical protein QUF72_11890 [Desulfobacterales bacterium HSG2]|nr:hypothetical protein [Desulfobacterales bacterium HSG2]
MIFVSASRNTLLPTDWQIRRRAWICQSKPSEAAQTKIMAIQV